MDDRLTGIFEALVDHAQGAGAMFVHADAIFATAAP
jgi:hypothetical protein